MCIIIIYCFIFITYLELIKDIGTWVGITIAVITMICCSGCVGGSPKEYHGYTRTVTHPPPRTTVVTSSAAGPRSTQRTAAFIMTAVRIKASTVKSKEKAQPLLHIIRETVYCMACMKWLTK